MMVGGLVAGDQRVLAVELVDHRPDRIGADVGAGLDAVNGLRGGRDWCRAAFSQALTDQGRSGDRGQRQDEGGQTE